jgi:hypothetical protein
MMGMAIPLQSVQSQSSMPFLQNSTGNYDASKNKSDITSSNEQSGIPYVRQSKISSLRVSRHYVIKASAASGAPTNTKFPQAAPRTNAINPFLAKVQNILGRQAVLSSPVPTFMDMNGIEQ